MPLRFDLGPFQELHIGRCMIKNSHERSLLAVEGSMPVLRGNEFIQEKAARAPLEKLYYCIQQMYLDEVHDTSQGRYLPIVAESLRAYPKLALDLEAADQLIRVGKFYPGLKVIKKLMLANGTGPVNFGRDLVGRFDGSVNGSNRFELEPFEELHIGRCMITNFHEKSLFVIEGQTPILRGNRFLRETSARAPLEKLYYCIQQMYLEEAHDGYQRRYLQYVTASLKVDPTLAADLEIIDHLRQDRDFCGALKIIQRLIPAAAFLSDNRAPSKVGRSANYIARVNGWKPRL